MQELTAQQVTELLQPPPTNGHKWFDGNEWHQGAYPANNGHYSGKRGTPRKFHPSDETVVAYTAKRVIA